MANLPFRNFFSSLKRRFSGLSRHSQIVIAILVVTVVAGIGIYFFGVRREKKAPDTQDNQQQYSNTFKTSLALTGKNKPNEAVKVWENYLSTHQAKEDQFNGYKQLGSSYFNAVQYDKAKEAFQKAQTLTNDQDTTILHSLALIEEKQGNTQAAIEGYKKVITVLTEKMKTQSEVDQFQTTQDIQTCKMAITRLGGTP